MKLINANLIASLSYGGKGYIKTKNYYSDFSVQVMVQPNGGGEKHLITGYNIKMDAQSQANYDNKSSKPIILNYDFVMPIAGIIVGCNTFYRGELINKGSVNDKINHAIGDKCSIRAELKILEW